MLMNPKEVKILSEYPINYDTIFGKGIYFMLHEKMKNVIKYAIELDIDYLESFLGYEGDKVLEITTRSKTAADLIESYVEKLDLDFRSEYEIAGKHGPGYNLFIGVEDPSVFKLKKDESFQK
ncbi:MAG: hypothetical protein OQK45_05160 [Sulfurovum sp.]|nr:hypothetical protein [Sulfurovum sp.]